jgi:Fur family ferric uptake transcriptional regulator
MNVPLLLTSVLRWDKNSLLQVVAISMTNHQTHHQPAVDVLKGTGHRLTSQRVLILEAVADLGGHITVERIHQRVMEQNPAIDQATVYRTVRLFSDLHLVNEVVLKGVAHYEYADPVSRHHHMVCEHCGTAIHLPPHYLDELQTQLKNDTGFEPHMEHFSISGLCAECRVDTAHSHSGHPHAHHDEPHAERHVHG